ncbi:hypothetical protein DO021_10075 [Desulfobacter hydrogenophilus]|uniref:Uncharacterized protein n=1 Tax=Desulfobacter hydrogenophilus TaxID=2291 RepID=A0A328FC20_9BACT|nr:hypothetical protein DO021_10075 [Desulfobacter hydrogenophilus]
MPLTAPFFAAAATVQATLACHNPGMKEVPWKSKVISTILNTFGTNSKYDFKSLITPYLF